MKLVSVDEMKAIESDANIRGVSSAMMMHVAGKGVGEWVQKHREQVRGRTVMGLIGSGNNGGDTLVALTFLSIRGWQATGYLVQPRQQDDPLLVEFLKAGGSIIAANDDPGYSKLAETMKTSSLLLDGILGTGIRLPLNNDIAGVLNFINHQMAISKNKILVVAVDCPSGVDCNLGKVAVETIHADSTLTMAAAKLGMLAFPAFEYIGKMEKIDIGVSDSTGLLGAIQRSVIDDEYVQGAMPARRLNSHKGDFGAALLLAGSERYTGAALLAGEAACRVGAGLVTLGVVEQVRSAIAGHLPEATWVVLPDIDGFLASQAIDTVLAAIEQATVMLIGCGWGMMDETHKFLHELLSRHAERLPPMVVDADGLKLLARVGGWQSQLPAGSVLTPHPGEMAILTGMTATEVQEDRLGLAERTALAWNQVVVLKGALTVVAASDGQTAIIPIATSALAHAGTGDVLAGMITGLMAQKVDAFKAACLGAYLHGMAGLAAAKAVGNTASILASDLLNYLPGVISRIK